MERETLLALDGMDPITFFEGEKPRRGKFELKLKMDGVVYCFVSAENKGRFARNSHSFVPQFGGHCAFCCGLWGGLVPASTENYLIRAGKLYLFQGPKSAYWWQKIPKLQIWGHSNYERKFKIKTK